MGIIEYCNNHKLNIDTYVNDLKKNRDYHKRFNQSHWQDTRKIRTQAREYRELHRKKIRELMQENKQLIFYKNQYIKICDSLPCTPDIGSSLKHIQILKDEVARLNKLYFATHEYIKELNIKIKELAELNKDREAIHKRDKQVIKELRKKVAFAIQELKDFGSIEAVEELKGGV
jgi:hypothetical protein